MSITIHAPTASLWTEQRGCGEDVLLLPGLGDDAHSWGGLADHLAASHRVTLVDTRGTGRSPSPERPWRTSHFVDDAVAVLDHYGIARAHVIGSCLGAITAQELAVAHPHRVQSLVLNGTWRATDPHFAALLSSWIWTAQHAQTLRELAQVVALSTSTPQHWLRGRVDDELQPMSKVRGNDLLRYRRGFTTAARTLRSYDAGARLQAIDVPTLLTVGEEDAVRPTAHTYEVAAEIAGSRVEVIRRAGRRAFADEPAVYAGLVSWFLSSAAQTVEHSRAA